METKNLDIHESTFDDCILFAKWEQDPAVTEFFTIDEGRSYEDVVTEYVLYRKDSTKMQFTITLKPELRPIGRKVVLKVKTLDELTELKKLADKKGIANYLVVDAEIGRAHV